MTINERVELEALREENQTLRRENALLQLQVLLAVQLIEGLTSEGAQRLSQAYEAICDAEAKAQEWTT